MSVQLFLQDCITGMPEHLASESVDLTVSSIPFAALFMYSGKTEDVENCADGVDLRGSMFGLNMRFVIEQLFRVIRPGRNIAIHIQQLLTYKVQHGYMGRRDFRGAVIDLFVAGGFEWKGEVAIPKNPQAMAQRQKLHSLLFVTGYRNSLELMPAVNDFLMIFQKPGEAERPVRCLFHPEQNPEGWVTRDEWIRWARGTWTDIQETDVLDGYRSARETDEERHVCPLQLEVIRRAIKMWSNPGDLVLDMFGGIGSTMYVAVEQGRSGMQFELKDSYHSQAQRNVQKAQAARKAVAHDLFSLLAEPIDTPHPNGHAADDVAMVATQDERRIAN